jgi:hypothetical protein
MKRATKANTTPTVSIKLPDLRRLSGFNRLLIAVLVVQLILAVVIYLPGAASVEQSRGPLLPDFKPESVTGLTIHDKDNGSQIVFAKNSAGEWTLPKADDYPLSNAQIVGLLGKVRALDTNRLIAQNRSSQSRLRVAPDAYERMLEIKQGEKIDRLYIGSSEGANAAHTRLNDQDPVYLTSGLTGGDVSTSISSWIDAPYFAVNQSIIARMVVTNKQGTFEFNKANDAFTLTGLAPSEKFNADKLTGLLGQISNVTLAAPLGKSEQDKYGMKAPLATLTLITREQVTVSPTPTSGAGLSGLIFTATPPATPPAAPQTITKTVEATYTLTLGAKLDSGNYVLKSSQSAYYVEISPALAEAFTALARTDLIVPPPTATATPSATAPATAPATIQATPAPTSAGATQPATSAPTQAATAQ